MEPTIFHIKPAGSFWHAEDINSNKTVLRGPLKRDLVIRTIERAKKEKFSCVVIHREDGSIEEQRSFDNNPEKFYRGARINF